MPLSAVDSDDMTQSPLNYLCELCCFILLDLFRGCRLGTAGSVRGRHCGLTGPAGGLRLPPFQVFTQRVAQPVLAGDGAVIRTSFWLVGHGVLCSNGLEDRPRYAQPGEPVMTETYALAPLPQQTLAGCHRFVTSGIHDVPAPPLAETVVFRSPFVQSRRFRSHRLQLPIPLYCFVLSIFLHANPYSRLLCNLIF